MNESTEIWPRIAERLTRLQQDFPADAVELAAAHWDVAAPYLLEELERVAADPAPACEPGQMRHLFAMFLMAQHRDSRAHDALLRIARLPDEVLDAMIGDITTDGLNRCLASTCGGDESGIKALIEDENANIWGRIAGLSALSTRVLEGDAAAEEMLVYLDSLGTREESTLDEDAERDIAFLTAIVNAALDVGAAPMLEQIRRWFAKELIDETSVDLDFVEGHAHEDHETLRRYGTHDRYVNSAIDEMKSWAFERPARPVPGPRVDPFVNRYGGPAQQPVVRETPKIGRNDPCPWGSGKKYKKCCGAA